MSWIHAACGNTRRRRMRICAACRGGLEASLGTLTKLNMQLSVNVRDSSEFYEFCLDLTFLSHRSRPVNKIFSFLKLFSADSPASSACQRKSVCARVHVCACVYHHTRMHSNPMH